MRNKYTYIGVGLLCVAALTSCSNEEVVSEKIKNTGLTEYTVTAEANFDKEAAGLGTRANVKEDGKSFIWNTGDKLTLWNGTQGYTFQAVESYDESIYYSKVEFKGEASFEEGQEIWGIYPYKESPSADNVFTFTLPQPQTQEGTAPALQNSMFMYAKGTVSGNTVSNMVFQHLTGTLHFTLTNKRGYDIALEKIVVSADSPVFPLSATLNADGTVSYANETNQFELNLNNQSVANNTSFDAYASVLPTDKMTGDTKLTISIKVAGTEELEVIKEGAVKSLYGEDTGFAKDGYKYVAGKRYGISKTLLPLEGDLGYSVSGNTYSVYAADGLVNVLSDSQITGKSDNTILLTQSIDMEGKSLPLVTTFAATLDGQNNVISHLPLSSSDDGKTGLVLANTGTIKNLKVTNVTLENKENVALLGILAASNTGTIENCEISDAIISIASCVSGGANIGFMAGESTTAKALIKNVSLTGSSIVVNGQVNFGGIVGKNGQWNAPSVIGASVGKDVTLTYKSGPGNSQFAGIVGWNNGGKVIGCSSAASIVPSISSHFGGVVSSNASGEVIASYCCGTMPDIAQGSNINAGGVIATNNATMKGCYSSVANTGDFGGLCGKANGTITDCYFYNCAAGKRNGQGSVDVSLMKVDNADALKQKISTLNTAISSYGFKYIENSDENEPLKLEAIN